MTRHVRTAITWAAVAVAAVLFYAANAAADPGTAAPAATTGMQFAGWAGAAYGLTILIPILMRGLASEVSWLHTAPGLALITFIGAACGAAGQSIQANGLHLATLWAACLGAVISCAVGYNPSGNASAPKALAARMRRVAVLIPLLIGLSGCAGAKAWGACELAALPQTAIGIVSEVTSIALSSADVVGDLVSLGKQFGPTQVDCVVKAIAADAAAKVAAQPPEPAVAAMRVPTRAETIVARLKPYLERKGASAAPVCPDIPPRVKVAISLAVYGYPVLF